MKSKTLQLKMSVIHYQLHFTQKRKTLGLQVKSGQLIVRAPNYLSEAQVESFVASKKSWIENKLALSQLADTQNKLLFNYCDGDRLFIFGKERTLCIKELIQDEPYLIKQNSKIHVDIILKQEQLVIFLSKEQYNSPKCRSFVKQHIQQWFDLQIQEYILNVLPEFEQRMMLFSQAIKFRIYKSRWGSCNSKKQLTFNSLLVMAPHYVIDYVITHELAHLKYMNHSTDFWQLVSLYCRNVESAKLWLKTHQKQLQLPD